MKPGLIVAILVIAGLPVCAEAQQRNEHFAAAKAAINALVRALAVELARYGVTATPFYRGGSAAK